MCGYNDDIHIVRFVGQLQAGDEAALAAGQKCVARGGDGLGKGAVIIARTRECESFLLANLQVFAVIYFLTHPFFCPPVNRASGYKLVCKTPYVRTVIRFGYLSGTLLVTSSFFFFVFFFSEIDNDFVTCVAARALSSCQHKPVVVIRILPNADAQAHRAERGATKRKMREQSHYGTNS